MAVKFEITNKAFEFDTETNRLLHHVVYSDITRKGSFLQDYEDLRK